MNDLRLLLLITAALAFSFYLGMRSQNTINNDDLDDALNDLILTNREDPWTSEEELVVTIDVLVEALYRS